MTADRTVGFVGLGQMGLPMARNLVKAGWDVLGYDIAGPPIKALRDAGGRVATDLAQIGRECRRVVVMVVNGEQVARVVTGEGGLLSAMTSGTVMVSSTITLIELRRVAELVERRGLHVIDSPVSGGEERAVSGRLTILCGGEPAVFEAQKSLLEVMGTNVVHLGPLGAGLVGKLANNLIIGVGRIAVGEAFGMARRAGVSLDALYSTLRTCSADSWLLGSLEPALLRGEYPSRTTHALKDIGAAVESAQSVGQAMPVTSLALELYRLADAKLGGLRGSNEVVRFFLEGDGAKSLR